MGQLSLGTCKPLEIIGRKSKEVLIKRVSGTSRQAS
jgi:hypothetical protein